jgi:hypothetical protein
MVRRYGGLCRQAVLATMLLTMLAFAIAYLAVR